jgi:DNA-binding MarR family transcriptional regulator
MALDELVAQRLIGGSSTPHALTPSGRDAADRLLNAYRDELNFMLKGWSPERHQELRDLCGRLAADVAPIPLGPAARR